MIAGVGHGRFPANCNTISISEHILNFYVKIWACSAEVPMNDLEGFGAHQNSVGVREAVSFALRVKQSVDGCFALPVPDLLEPFPREGFVRIRHGG